MFNRILLMVLCFCMALSVGCAVLENAMSTVAYESGTSIEEDRNSLNALQNNLSSIQTNKENLQALIDKTNMETQTMLQEKMLLEQEYTLLVDEENAINDIIAEYERIMKAADKVTYTSEQYYSGCMHKRNRHLVDNSSVCVCYLTESTGGTAYTVEYAHKNNLTVINLGGTL